MVKQLITWYLRSRLRDDAQLTLLFISPVHGLVSPTFRVGLPKLNQSKENSSQIHLGFHLGDSSFCQVDNQHYLSQGDLTLCLKREFCPNFLIALYLFFSSKDSIQPVRSQKCPPFSAGSLGTGMANLFNGRLSSVSEA